MVALRTQSRKAAELADIRLRRRDASITTERQRDMMQQRQRRNLSDLLGVNDESLLQRLIDRGITERNHEALRYAPVAEVAWASGRVTEQERVIAIKPMFSEDLFSSPAGSGLFRSWLMERPDALLLDLWECYVKARLAQPDYADQERDFGQSLYELAEKIALASGGLMNQGAICPAEKLALNRIVRAYDLKLD